MFDDELNDLKIVYQSTIDEIDDEIEDDLPILLRHMKQFLQLNEQREVVEEKLENLIAKFNHQGEENE